MQFSAWLIVLAVTLFLAYIVVLLVADCDLRLLWVDKFGKPIGSLKGQVVWVTGASSGIGEQLAVTLAQHGVRLVLSSRRKEELERVKKQCIVVGKTQLRSEDVLVLPLDITRVETHETHFKKVIEHFGCLDVLVNNAGRSQIALWENIDTTVDEQMFQLNVFGVISLTRLAVRYFVARGTRGHVVVTSSLAGVIGLPFSSTYTATKWALHGYFNSLRLEKSRTKLKVTIFCPGQTFSNCLTESFTDKVGEKYAPEAQPDRQMPVSRCSRLYAVALANQLPEAWVALMPFVFFCYLMTYYPVVGTIILKAFDPEQFKPQENIGIPKRMTSSKVA